MKKTLNQNTLSDSDYMSAALEQAHLALANNEVPIGAVIVNKEGEIIGRGHNLVEIEKQQIAHAEVKAIIQASAQVGDWRLNECSIYVTLEPCAMCFNLILLSRIKKLIFGTPSPVFGYRLDNRGPVQVYRRDLLEVAEGIQAQECSQLLKIFFKTKRKNQ